MPLKHLLHKIKQQLAYHEEEILFNLEESCFV